MRDPTADIDVVSYCFGVPQQQYLAEGIDRSLIRRAMWGLLPEKVLTNRMSGLQAADWYEKLGNQRGELARQVAELSQSAWCAGSSTSSGWSVRSELAHGRLAHRRSFRDIIWR